MAGLVYPRLLPPVAQSRIKKLQALPITELPDRNPGDLDLDAFVFSATGGSRVKTEKLVDLRKNLLELGRRQGFPNPVPTRARNAFDAAAAELLKREMEITPNEASKPGIWPFLCCEILPDLVRWRFPGDRGETGTERFSDGVRNTFGRLWWRALVLGGPEESESSPLDLLGEDEMVQLMERPGLRGNSILARAAAHRLGELGNREPRLPRMDLMRDVQKRFIRLQPFISYESLGEREIQELVEQVFSEAIRAMGWAHPQS